MENSRQPSDKKTARHSCARAAMVRCLAPLVLLAVFSTPAAGAIELSNTPLFSRGNPPPPAIMFLIDDSYSMDHEVLFEDAGFKGDFCYPLENERANANPGGQTAQAGYIFDWIEGDYTRNGIAEAQTYLGSENRRFWKTQWCETNLLYYDPSRTYAPWPSHPGMIFTDADRSHARSDPTRSFTLDLSDDSFVIGETHVPHAHYFVYSHIDGAPYLVVVDGEITYYKVAVSVHEQALDENQKCWWQVVSGLELSPSPPPDVVSARTYLAERQNFANWYTYHRRREFVVKKSLAHLLTRLKNVRVGFYGINSHDHLQNASQNPICATLKPVNVASAGSVSDKTPELLDALYSYRSRGETPLRTGLDKIGRFFCQSRNGNLPGTEAKEPSPPFLAPCQRAFSVIVSDGYYTDGEKNILPSGRKNADGDDPAPYADGYADTLADIAMHYYETDLQPGGEMPDQVPATQGDTNAAQHMATYAIAFGARGTLDPDDYDGLKSKTAGTWISWPKPGEDSRIDDLWHATVNGRGRFFSARRPQELYEAFESLAEAVADIETASAAPVAVNGDPLYGKAEAGSRVYQTSYHAHMGEWTGDLRAYQLDPSTGGISGDAIWSAAEQLESADWDSRVVVTYDPMQRKGIPFRNDSLTAALKTALGGAAEAEKSVRYLRGGAVAGYRERTTRLGDIVNAGAVFEESVIYSGANDGMLHAFDARSGAERFAYVPGLVFGNLRRLTQTNYTHRFFVDLPPTVKKGKGLLRAEEEAVILVGGLRQGGKGYFAIDITAAGAIRSETQLAGRILWEFPDLPEADMGFSYSKPIVVRSNSAAFPWLVIFGNGYGSDSGRSVLYILDARTGSVIKRIAAGAGPDNGLSSPAAVDVDADERVDFVFAGDLHGNLWKFDLTDDAAVNPDWRVAYGDGTDDPAPLFQARGPRVEPEFPAGTPQPITTRPDVMMHPAKKGFLVCFGTGRLLGEPDSANSQIQSVYGIWDYGDPVFDKKTNSYSPADAAEYVGSLTRGATPEVSNPRHPRAVALVHQELLDVGVGQGVCRLLATKAPDWSTVADSDRRQNPNPAKSIGWVLDLTPGERVISDVIIRSGRLMIVGFTPSSDPCGGQGSSLFIELDAFTGGRLRRAQLDVSGDGRIDAKDWVRVDFDGVNTLAPSGLKFNGCLQLPAILRIPEGLEIKFLSSSTGHLVKLVEKAPRLGVTYWMEVHSK